ncbi:uridine diphosphate-N-acetylglucosamine-binding protein YvcK [Nocardioides sp. TRM66260-LWL]|uniref:gluconeogenesis factor YvcK family protein n=1 Tax=Nocardioides sp. TRM66260-LWL TaxID=2874478 RepID=UPI001CC44981|nr:uridine diphosphate-N-acetylglucosamine-binding protein YvcK [Nocardioides sp. TRM66260-LWL]MBZ5736219.1 uridine diphosphate-N-acetylglucosamine-binding protein YvcK [Nocardioides sp. TRM66260-LWL]
MRVTVPDVRLGQGRSVVAFGGGHGLSASLRALRELVHRRVVGDLTAVVTVADNGGSSGRLRGEFGVLPPGDLRMALAALCRTDDWGDTWAGVLQHRFAGDGEMNGHVVGNLLIVAMWEQLGDHVRALDLVGRLLGAAGRVLPMALSPMDIRAQVRGLDPLDPESLTTVRGQVQVARTDGVIASIELEPSDPEPCPEAIAAVDAADWVVLGPGSWFTSVIPHLMVPALREALVRTPARRAVVLNLDEQAGETHGFGPADHLAVLAEHAPELRIDVVLADTVSVEGHEAELEQTVKALGARLVVADVALGDGTPRHDPHRLAAAFEHILAEEPAAAGPRG